MNTIRFDSTMVKFSPVRKQEDVYNILQLKVVEDSSIRSLPQQFKGQIDLSNVFQPAASNDPWDKINIPVSEYRMDYTITFSDCQFEAKLENIAAAIKIDRAGVPSTEYTLTFQKELDKDLDSKLSLYLKRKEEDPETGKKALMFYNTVLEEKV